MAVTVNIDKARVQAKVMDAWDKGLAELTEIIKDDCNDYCKEYQGDLQDSANRHSLPKEGKIIWQTPYARRQYWEIQTAYTDKNPRATWKWAEVAKVKCRDKWALQAQKLMEANL